MLLVRFGMLAIIKVKVQFVDANQRVLILKYELHYVGSELVAHDKVVHPAVSEFGLKHYVLKDAFSYSILACYDHLAIHLKGAEDGNYIQYLFETDDPHFPHFLYSWGICPFEDCGLLHSSNLDLEMFQL